MSESSKKQDSPQLCTECKDMFGHPNFKGMCSKCYKTVCDEADKKVGLILKRKSTQGGVSWTEKVSPKTKKAQRGIKMQKKEEKKLKYGDQLSFKTQQQQIQKEKSIQIKKCKKCQKKVGLLGHCCSHCNENYCKFHRLPEEHECRADFIGLGRKKLKLQNPIMQTSKIQKI